MLGLGFIVIVVLVGVIIYSAKKNNHSPIGEGGLMKILYAIILGVMLAFFVGLGIEAFYPTEKYPEMPIELQYGEKIPASTPQNEATLQLQKEYEQTVKEYQARNETHARNVSIMAVVAAVLYLTLSLTILTRTNSIFSDGFLIGSLLTLLYGIARGFETNDNKFRFIIVTIGLAIALALGYIKFVRQKESK